jgi:hypothetical protein
VNTNLRAYTQGSQCEIRKSVVEGSDSTPVASTPMSNPPSSNSGISIPPPENNVQIVDILATKTAELLAERFNGNLKKSDKKDKSKDKKIR